MFTNRINFGGFILWISMPTSSGAERAKSLVMGILDEQKCPLQQLDVYGFDLVLKVEQSTEVQPFNQWHLKPRPGTLAEKLTCDAPAS
jgi:hypothetical protein